MIEVLVKRRAVDPVSRAAAKRREPASAHAHNPANA
jgi:hypothetical protein